MSRALVAGPVSSLVALAMSLSVLTGCVPVVVAGAVGGAAMVATDRRSAGAQVDDESIELKVNTRANIST